MHLTQQDYAAIAAFRFKLRRFTTFSEAVASKVGLPPQQHQALLAIAGHSQVERPSGGHIAEQLLIAPHTAAELISRMADAGLITKTSSADDRGRMDLTLTPQAEGLLRKLTEVHLDELRNLKPALIRALNALPRT